MLYQIKQSLLVLSRPLMLSCSGDGNNAKNESTTAYTDYENFVSDFEQDSLSEVELRAMQEDTISWAQMKENQAQEYKQMRQRVEQNNASYEPEQQEEIQDLDERYNAAITKREQQYKDASHRYRLRNQLLGLKIKKDDLSDLTQEDIASTYERFAGTVAENAGTYEAREWNLIEGWWSALNSRYSTLEKDLPQQAKRTIEKAQAQYKEVREKHASS